MVVKEGLQKYVSERSSLHSCFLDMKKAFKSVIRKLLIDKIVKKDITWILVQLVKHILDKTFESVEYSGCSASSWKAT